MASFEMRGSSGFRLVATRRYSKIRARGAVRSLLCGAIASEKRVRVAPSLWHRVCPQVFIFIFVFVCCVL